MNFQSSRALFFSLLSSLFLLGLALPARAQTDPMIAKTPSDMVYVPAGEFIMGTNKGEDIGPNTPRYTNDARPQHKPTAKAFYIDKTEVTNAAYKKFCDATDYPVPPHWKNGKLPEGADNFPVTHINWHEASAYAAWIGKRLPTEIEWEKPARGTDARSFPWGNNWDANRVVTGRESAAQVATKPDGASPYGALDMAGNVYEWTQSWYDAYPNAPHKFPEYNETMKVIRGGGYDFQSIAQTFFRSVAFPRTRSDWIGFRCAQDA